MNQTYWDKATAFHGHECPGLAIGVRVCEAAVEKLGISSSFDEELVCITESDTCGVDAVQAVLSCTLGKGNLIFKNTGKQAYTFISRQTGKALRFYLRFRRDRMDRDAYQQYVLDTPVDVLFACQELVMEAPEYARLFSSVVCEKCGELASEQKIRIQGGKQVCLDCYKEYNRGW